MPEIWKNNYILDIDLDFFHYKSSIEVNDYSFFNKLIKNSKAITIARESVWIEQWRIKHDKNLSVEFLEKKLLEIITEATKHIMVTIYLHETDKQLIIKCLHIKLTC